jgi:hypothetical protein
MGASRSVAQGFLGPGGRGRPTIAADQSRRGSPDPKRLRLDRRAEWASTDASPFGFGLRGVLPDVYRDDYWLYEEFGARIWMHHDNERAPARPLVFVLEMSDTEMEQRRATDHPDERTASP